MVGTVYGFCLFFLVLVSYSHQQDVAPYYFRKDYKYKGSQSAFYKLHKTELIFSEAIQKCAAEGAKLLVPTSKEEIDIAFGLAKGSSVPYMWIGAHDLNSEGEFVTVDGADLEDVYVNWGQGEPNNAGTGEHCVLVRPDGTYNDERCSVKCHFVCRRSTVGLVQNNACETFDMDFKYSLNLDKCYKLSAQTMNWQQAFKECRISGSRLAVINDENEANYLVGELAKNTDASKDRVFLGFNDFLELNTWKTIDGKNLTDSGYLKWGNGEPSGTGKEYCGSMFRDGTLGVTNCSSAALFFCEKGLADFFKLDVRVGDS